MYVYTYVCIYTGVAAGGVVEVVDDWERYANCDVTCFYMCIHTYAHMYVYTGIYTHTYSYIYTWYHNWHTSRSSIPWTTIHLCVGIYTHTYSYIYTCTHKYIHEYTLEWQRVGLSRGCMTERYANCDNTCFHMFIYTFICMYVYIGMYTH